MSSALHSRMPQRRWLSRAATAAAGTLSVTAYGAQVLLGRSLPTWLFITLLTLGLIATCGAVWLQEVVSRDQEHKREIAEETRDGVLAIVASYLTPLVDIKNRLVNAEEPAIIEASKSELIRAIVGSADSDLFPNRTRCCYFELSTDEQSHRKLTCERYAGRASKPTWELVEGKGIAGDYIFRKIIDQRRSEVRERLTKADFHEWDESLGFQSAIACAVFCGDKTFGMLLWDAPEAHDMDDTHHLMAQLLAQELGIMLAIKRSNTPLSPPDEASLSRPIA
jgi:hypothetical protein